MNSAVGSRCDPARPFFSRIMVEMGHHDYEAAAAGFKLFLELHPTSSLTVQADYWLGECAYRLGRYQEAIDAFDHALSRAPFNPQLVQRRFWERGTATLSLEKLAAPGASSNCS
jgi:Uncharacterized protein conserved in bacteria